MARNEDFYSRFVAWMKIILPLVALALLSTLFLISRTIDPTKLPIVEIDLEQKAQEQGATKPSFAGMTSGGDEVTFQAQRARPDLEDPELLIADDVSAQIRLIGGTILDITAQHADLHQKKLTASLADNVVIQTSQGYQIETGDLKTRLDVLYAETTGRIDASGPPGDLTAGRMILTSDEETGNAEILFTDGVKLIYTPDRSKE